MQSGYTFKCKNREEFEKVKRKAYLEGFRTKPDYKALTVEILNHGSVTEIIDQACDDICMNFCKYPDTWDEEENGPLADSEICEHCPLNALR